ncbi:MAG: hypothetical protein Q8P33_00405 [bacterium]|nr:hypothetical protein [bacterium]
MQKKKFVALALVAVLASISVFGFALMGHDAGGCILATSQAIECPTQTAPLGAGTFHTFVLEKLSQASVSDFSLGLLLFVVALSGAVPTSLLLRHSLSGATWHWVKRRRRHPPPASCSQLIVRWLKQAAGVEDYSLVAALT